MTGPEFTAVELLIAFAYALWSLAPILWPAIVAWRVRPTLPRRRMFVAIVAMLVYGATTLLFVAVILPFQVFAIYLAPQLEAAGLAPDANLLGFGRYVLSYWWVIVPPVQLGLTWYVSRKLSAKWRHICAALMDSSRAERA